MCDVINSAEDTPAIIERFHIPVILSLMKTIDAETEPKKNKALQNKLKKLLKNLNEDVKGEIKTYVITKPGAIDA